MNGRCEVQGYDPDSGQPTKVMCVSNNPGPFRKQCGVTIAVGDIVVSVNVEELRAALDAMLLCQG